MERKQLFFIASAVVFVCHDEIHVNVMSAGS